MRKTETIKKAKALGIKKVNIKKLELIREMQKKEGNFPCFGTATDFCDQNYCCFREDCMGKNYYTQRHK